jgi:hypothetical protein
MNGNRREKGAERAVWEEGKMWEKGPERAEWEEEERVGAGETDVIERGVGKEVVVEKIWGEEEEREWGAGQLGATQTPFLMCDAFHTLPFGDAWWCTT